MARLLDLSEATSIAVHTMALLGRYPDRRFTNAQIAEMLAASSHHLAKVMLRLVKVGLVGSVSGPHGGFRLARPAREITFLDVYEAVEGPLAMEGCPLGRPICDGHPEECVLGDLVQSIEDQIRRRLTKVTVAKLAQGVGFPEPSADSEIPATGDSPRSARKKRERRQTRPAKSARRLK